MQKLTVHVKTFIDGWWDLNIMFTITPRKFFINETQWKYVTEISILCINMRKRSLTNYEEYSRVVSEVTNVPQKAKIYTNVQDLNSMTEGWDYTQGGTTLTTLRIHWKCCLIMYHIGFKRSWLETKKLHNFWNAQGKNAYMYRVLMTLFQKIKLTHPTSASAI